MIGVGKNLHSLSDGVAEKTDTIFLGLKHPDGSFESSLSAGAFKSYVRTSLNGGIKIQHMGASIIRFSQIFHCPVHRCFGTHLSTFQLVCPRVHTYCQRFQLSSTKVFLLQANRWCLCTLNISLDSSTALNYLLDLTYLSAYGDRFNKLHW